MTRKSKREIEREIEQLQTDTNEFDVSDISSVFMCDDTGATDSDTHEDVDVGIGDAFLPDGQQEGGQ